MTASCGTYVYCVGSAEAFADTHDLFTAEGVGGGVRVVTYNGLAAVVGDSLRRHFELNREHLLAHHRVLDEAMARSTVLPVAFGTVAEGDHDVREELLRRACQD